MKIFFLMYFLVFFSPMVAATTYANKTLDEAYHDAEIIAEIYVERATQVIYSGYDDEDESEICATNVIASISEDFKESVEGVIYFHTGIDVQAGESYFVIVPRWQERGSAPEGNLTFVYESEEERLVIEEKYAAFSAYCESNLYDLSMGGFPQEMMKITNSSGDSWLELSLNNIIFPDVVMVEYKEEYHGIAQYVDRLVHYEDLKEYLRKIKANARLSIESAVKD